MAGGERQIRCPLHSAPFAVMYSPRHATVYIDPQSLLIILSDMTIENSFKVDWHLPSLLRSERLPVVAVQVVRHTEHGHEDHRVGYSFWDLVQRSTLSNLRSLLWSQTGPNPTCSHNRRLTYGYVRIIMSWSNIHCTVLVVDCLGRSLLCLERKGLSRAKAVSKKPLIPSLVFLARPR